MVIKGNWRGGRQGAEDPEGGQAHLFFQVQDDEHRIIAPSPFAEVPFRLAPWM